MRRKRTGWKKDLYDIRGHIEAHPQHMAYAFYPDKDIKGSILCIVREITFPTTAEQIVKILQGEWERCPMCGELIPELAFYVGNRCYTFTCKKITEDDKIIAETNYEQSELFLHASNTQRKRNDDCCQ